MARKLSTHSTELELSLSDVEVHYEHYPASFGRREANSGGLQLEPDFPEQIEIFHVYAKTPGGGKLDILKLLSESEVISIEDEILEARSD